MCKLQPQEEQQWFVQPRQHCQSTQTIKGKLNKVFLDHNTSLGMIKLLANTDNAINMVKTNQMISVDNVIDKAKKEAMTASAAARKKDKSAEGVEPTITKREEAKREAKRQNMNQ